VRPLQEGEQVLSDDEHDFGKEIPVQLGSIVRRVVMNKNISNDAADKVKTLCDQYCPTASVERSTL
jgi:hypothetical protein